MSKYPGKFPANGLKFNGAPDFLSKFGQEFEPGNHPGSYLPQGLMNKACFANCHFYAGGRYVYAEGFMTLKKMDFPFEHSWLVDVVTKNVVEITLDEPGEHYFGAIFTHRSVVRAHKVNGEYSMLFGMGKFTKQIYEGIIPTSEILEFIGAE